MAANVKTQVNWHWYNYYKVCNKVKFTKQINLFKWSKSSSKNHLPKIKSCHQEKAVVDLFTHGSQILFLGKNIENWCLSKPEDIHQDYEHAKRDDKYRLMDSFCPVSITLADILPYKRGTCILQPIIYAKNLRWKIHKNNHTCLTSQINNTH